MNEMQELKEQLVRIEAKVDATFASAEKMRKYFKWTLIVTLVTIILPMIGLAFVIPFYMNTLNVTDVSNLDGLGL